eukprot:m.179685 g.179685  ORF g.179685 m.179685 type:complete len:459 (+) comp15369_c0_seq18:1049-2425(+)
MAQQNEKYAISVQYEEIKGHLEEAKRNGHSDVGSFQAFWFELPKRTEYGQEVTHDLNHFCDLTAAAEAQKMAFQALRESHTERHDWLHRQKKKGADFYITIHIPVSFFAVQKDAAPTTVLPQAEAEMDVQAHSALDLSDDDSEPEPLPSHDDFHASSDASAGTKASAPTRGLGRPFKPLTRMKEASRRGVLAKSLEILSNFLGPHGFVLSKSQKHLLREVLESFIKEQIAEEEREREKHSLEVSGHARGSEAQLSATRKLEREFVQRFLHTQHHLHPTIRENLERFLKLDDKKRADLKYFVLHRLMLHISREQYRFILSCANVSSLPSEREFNAVWEFFKAFYSQDVLRIDANSFRRPVLNCLGLLLKRLRICLEWLYPKQAAEKLKQLTESGVRGTAPRSPTSGSAGFFCVLVWLWIPSRTITHRVSPQIFFKLPLLSPARRMITWAGSLCTPLSPR